MNKLGLGFLPILWLVLGCRDAPPPVGDPYFAPPALVDGRFNVAILVTDGVSNTEIAAPSDVFGQTQFHEGIRAMNVFTVSEKKQPGRAAGGLRFLPDFDFSDAPKTDILVVPGAQNRAGGHIFNQKTVDFVEKMGACTTATDEENPPVLPKIFPNPTENGHFFVEIPTEGRLFSVEILDLTGRRMYFKNDFSFENKTEIRLPNQLENGLFLVKTTTVSGVFIQKLFLGQP